MIGIIVTDDDWAPPLFVVDVVKGGRTMYGDVTGLGKPRPDDAEGVEVGPGPDGGLGATCRFLAILETVISSGIEIRVVGGGSFGYTIPILSGLFDDGGLLPGVACLLLLPAPRAPLLVVFDGVDDGACGRIVSVISSGISINSGDFLPPVNRC